MTTEVMTRPAVLDLPMGENDADAATVRDYLKALLKELWSEGEGFSGKRPFGSSCWEHELYKPLIVAGYVAGALDEDGYIDTVDSRKADHLIALAIASLK